MQVLVSTGIYRYHIKVVQLAYNAMAQYQAVINADMEDLELLYDFIERAGIFYEFSALLQCMLIATIRLSQPMK